MNKLKIIALILLIVSPIAVYFLWPSDEGRIRKLIRQTAQAAEAHDAEGVMKSVDLNYRDSYGLSYLYLKKILKRELKRLEDLDVRYSQLRVEVFKDETAEASMELAVLANMGQERGYYLGGPDHELILTVTLGKNQFGIWKVTRAEYDLGGRIPIE
jgi:hypothetical protein